ncbi:cation-translocating P-type ATPase [Leptospira langatensis]|uniref:Cation-translocating P-type ATPase n=1 Tax=Leptospira langatensis TaxID=2484983 RepID=A0A5F2A0B1_9LEPT|nr:cation-translocating P-type ATPase [Leptospira langatensis]TGL43669.1 cation-translocating P-type ATPase [Leptospira langatensis]
MKPNPSYQGLSSKEAEDLLKQFGPNETASESGSLWKTVISVLKEPMLLLLLFCGLIYAVLGDLEEALTLSFAVIAVIFLTILQMNKSRKAIESLKDLAPSTSKVYRDGKWNRINSTKIVPGDIVLIAEGNFVPADGSVLEALNLYIDESQLTGESVPVLKSRSESEMAEKDLEDSGKVYSGSIVLSGEGIFQVTATGASSWLGSIGTKLDLISESESPLQREARQFTSILFLGALVLSAFIFLGLFFHSREFLRSILAGLTFLMAALPEEIPVVMSVFFSLGAWRISKVGVLTKNLNSIETLGAATILCVDKTGTLTENNMKLRGLISKEMGSIFDFSQQSFPEEYHELLEFAILASRKDPFDPMERAIKETGFELLNTTEHLHDDWDLKREYPLTPKLLALSYAWSSQDHEKYVIGAKGAPEAIFDLCHFSEPETARWKEAVDQYSSQGYRTIAVAKSEFSRSILPENQHDLDFDFLGLLLLEDPIRDSVPSSVAQCKSAGIRVVLITGDYQGTAKAVASKIGLSFLDCITGDEIESMEEEEFLRKIETVGIFSRIRPDQKLKIVQAFQKKGEIVAMTGDGVNDGLALQAAHIGVSMGKRGTDVAREASDLVLLDDNFSAIVYSVMLGRRIYENIKKSISYIVVVHIPIIGMSILPAITGDEIFFFPIHVLLLELIIDPSCTLIFESLPMEERMALAPPRKSGSKLLSNRDFLVSIAQGTICLSVLLLFYFWAKGRNLPETDIRSYGFVFIVASNFGSMFGNLSSGKERFSIFRRLDWKIYLIPTLSTSLLIIIFTFDLSIHMFGFAQVSWYALFIAWLSGIFSGFFGKIPVSNNV